MHIKTISIKNFRLLKESVLRLDESPKQELALLIGKNNSGKTSFIILFDKFFRTENYKFNFNDFSISLREEILNVSPDSNLTSVFIQMKLELVYSKNDNLEHLSELILDLNPNENVVKLLFECSIDKNSLLLDLDKINEKHKKKFIEKNLTDYLVNKYYTYIDEKHLDPQNRHLIVEKTITDIRKVINYQVIHAKRNVSSSEYYGNGKTALSELATNYFNKENSFSQEAFSSINDAILDMDEELNKHYAKHFKSYFDSVKQFVDDGKGEVNIISNLESAQIISNYSKVVYGTSDTYLPETMNGLGHLNVLFLLLKIEVKKKFFQQENKEINLLFIEEPEAHTHPQMQYIFAKKIEVILKEIPKLQTFITTHSSHIVSQCDFKSVRYFKLIEGNNIEIKNFFDELKTKYSGEPEHFQFLKQYLTLYSSELFFAEKVIFIEGISEKLLLPFFIKQYDKSRKENHTPLTSQNITYIEAGANARVFCHFLDFLDIKTLIFTDLDGCKVGTSEDGKKKCWSGCKTSEAFNTFNVTIKHYLNAPVLPKINELENRKKETDAFRNWFQSVKNRSANSISRNINVFCQIEENLYHARSFEDAFFSVNMEFLESNKAHLNGLKNKSAIVSSDTDYYELTKKVLESDGKSDFASSVLYLALTKDIQWNTPKYILEGLDWIAK